MVSELQPADGGEETREAKATRIVAGLVALAGDAEASRILGIGGTLEDEVDLLFVSDPLGWIASDIVQAMELEEEEDEGVSLSSVVAQVRLYRVLRGKLDQRELVDAVLERLGQTEEE